MKDRIYIKDLKGNVGKEVAIAGPNRKEVMEIAGKMRPEWVLKITGIVNKRPEKNIKAGVVNGNVELEVTNIEVLSQATELPYALDAELNFDTYLDYSPRTAPGPKRRALPAAHHPKEDPRARRLLQENFSEFEA